MSSGKFSRRAAISYRAAFARRWQGFLHDNFDCAEEVAVAFGVEASTARKWWEGGHSPSGAFVGVAFMLLPGQAAEALTRPEAA